MSGIMAVLAHPDDESFMTGALTHYRRRGRHASLITLTDGQAGRTGLTGEEPMTTREKLGEVRRVELQRAAEVMEVSELITPGLMDGALKQIPDEEGIRLVTESVRRYRPSVVLTFGPEGGGSGHPDHKAAHRWAYGSWDLAADESHVDGLPPHQIQKLYYISWPGKLSEIRGISTPESTAIVEIGKEVAEAKVKAFAEHKTQQDHLELYNLILNTLDGKEYYHLARSRVTINGKIETDLFAGLA